ncbi:MAG: GNAT family N-acetyltransferase [Candidatus Sulfotelmatobacter sp.]
MQQMKTPPSAATQLKTRTAEPADAENISHLVNAAFRLERFFVDADRTNPDKVRELLQKGNFLLAEDAGALVACVYVELRGDRGYFGLLAVDPARQRAGMGSRLIDTAEEYCRAAGCRFMDLTVVNLRKELPGYYRSRGYVENGTLPFPSDQYPPKMPCHLVRMSKPLA